MRQCRAGCAGGAAHGRDPAIRGVRWSHPGRWEDVRSPRLPGSSSSRVFLLAVRDHWARPVAALRRGKGIGRALGGSRPAGVSRRSARWCGRWESNPQFPRDADFKSAASASSATPAECRTLASLLRSRRASPVSISGNHRSGTAAMAHHKREAARNRRACFPLRNPWKVHGWNMARLAASAVGAGAVRSVSLRGIPGRTLSSACGGNQSGSPHLKPLCAQRLRRWRCAVPRIDLPRPRPQGAAHDSTAGRGA